MRPNVTVSTTFLLSCFLIMAAACLASQMPMPSGSGPFPSARNAPVAALAAEPVVSAEWYPIGSGISFWGHSISVYQDELILGGWFSSIGGEDMRSVAAWDGAHWRPLGWGMPSGYPAAFALYQDQLIAGGTFVNAGMSPGADRIAAWDGSRWNKLGGGVSGEGNASVIALSVQDGNLIAAGVFDRAGGAPARNIARWDGGQWSPLGSGVNGPVCALATWDGLLVAGGMFTEAGGLPAHNIAVWDGVSWEPLDMGLPATGSVIWALAVFDGDLVAGGIIASVGASEAGNVVRWNGAAWEPLGDGVAGGAVFDGAVGSFQVHGGRLIAAGLFDQAGDGFAGNIAAWDGTEWTSVGLGMDFGILALGEFRGDLIATGAFTRAGTSEASYVARWSENPQSGGKVEQTPPSDVRMETDGSGKVELLAVEPRSGAVRADFTMRRRGTTVLLDLEASTQASLAIYNVGGRRVRELGSGLFAAGRHEYYWNRQDDAGQPVGPGIYFCRMGTERGTKSLRIVLTN